MFQFLPQLIHFHNVVYSVRAVGFSRGLADQKLKEYATESIDIAFVSILSVSDLLRRCIALSVRVAYSLLALFHCCTKVADFHDHFFSLSQSQNVLRF